MIEEKQIAVIGLGYVGLPLAAEFAKKYSVVGFDINEKRVHELTSGYDSTLEVSNESMVSILKTEINSSPGLFISNKIDSIQKANVYIVTVPTPVDKFNRPDLTPLYKASETVGRVLKINDIVIYESTVYPGVTEDECVPVLEKISGLIFNKDFFVGYSPERINPGDKEHTITKIKKVTSGSTPEAAKEINELYESIIVAGTHLAPSIKVAEAAKVIENSQRDINIAFVNELSKIFNLLGIDTNEVLEAARTKWNFLPFTPGLVGGHCIGVDPYYLAQKAQEVGYHPEILLAGRRLNDSMGAYVADQIIKQMVKNQINIIHSNILILGFTFKENCPDVRNTRVIDIYNQLSSYQVNITIFDPWASAEEVKREYNLSLSNVLPKDKKFDAIILAVSHQQFLDLDIESLSCKKCVLFDVKSVLPKSLAATRL
ncbi:MAG: nucleotide sugar dehydrogenase [Ginsengibacter sp.]